ncbi:ribonuclease H-like domain-containing protein [Lactarius psammicola]|nr:ribonuclease H-like domain-containing protein [Lactarius psammicola]
MKDKPSGNWLSLHKRLQTDTPPDQPRKKRQKRQDSSFRASDSPTPSAVKPSVTSSPLDESFLRKDTDCLPGQYIALDCEMVGVGPMGAESTLARVSVVNYFGAVLLDEFVRQKERVTDWRTQWSGVRAKDMINAKTFEEVQGIVAELIKDRIVVGHAIQNDLKALMLSHPRAQTRDTQHLAHKHGQSRTGRPALRNLVRDMLGATIQAGEHSSVTDARATMAIYRLHRKQWESGYDVVPIRVQRKGRAKAVPNDSDPPIREGSGRTRSSREPPATSHPSETRVGSITQRKGISSGMSTVVRRPSTPKGGVDGTKEKWWTVLSGTGEGSKGSIRVTM